ncbi:PAK-box P21-Rho-binding [Cordyceps militaris]|uniref:PAK-box P21-Rho-binding n=1 Tax=Cordyceps militaris TaxID=73501 RepID=A0A2H4S8Z5_CORMI|nr:PAK-box P21-Rho-binding [Cordyceps militaris]
MWASGSPSYYSGFASRPAPLLRDRPAKNVDKTCVSQRGQTSDAPGTITGLAELYLPAVEAPPSPESLRQLNADMRMATNLRRGYGHKLGSSSSSVLSFGGDLDQVLDNMDMVRRSSFTSTESTHLSRDASEAFQHFSKNLFHRRGRSKQESTSSGSSLYSAEVPSDPAGAMKDSVIPKLFTRRKPSRDEPATLHKRFQISDPFNFQHVTHTNRDTVEDVLALEDDQLDPSRFRGRPRAATGVSQHTYTNVLAETVAEHETRTDILPPRPRLAARHTGSFQTMRRFIKSGKVADLPVPIPTSAPANRQPPQRPPRSPPVSPESSSPPVPPRVSSRQRFYSTAIETRTSYFAERPVNAGNFQRPRPFTPSSPTPACEAFTPPTDFSSIPQEGLLGRPRTATPEPAWPLASPTIASFEAPLPDLIEDDGHTSWSSVAHTNRNSTNASLRGSRSVPTLAKLAEEQGAAVANEKFIEPSAWSAQMKMALEESVDDSPTLGRASWEDDIDYCYEHEAEADCDYQWERPSMDVSPAGRMYAASQSFSALDDALLKSSAKRSHGMPSASGIEVPELSPASQTSAVLGHEAITPLTCDTAADAQFRHKNTELIVAGHLHGALTSQFSPSLLVPHDYQRESDSFMASGLKSASLALQRSSTATTASNFTSSTDSIGERHTSTNSSWTALTRHTASTSSLNKLGMSWVDEAAEPVPVLTAPAEAEEEPTAHGETTPPTTSEDVVPELVMALPPAGRRFTLHKSHASESVVCNSVTPMDAQPLPKSRRPRARTSSLSQAPPIGQYALFPRSSIKTHGDKI